MRNDDADHLRASSDHTARDRAGVETFLLDNFQDVFARFGLDVRIVVDDARNRRTRNSGFAGDIFQTGSFTVSHFSFHP